MFSETPAILPIATFDFSGFSASAFAARSIARLPALDFAYYNGSWRFQIAGAVMRQALLRLDAELQKLGLVISQITMMVLALSLMFVPVLAMLAVTLALGVWASSLLGGGVLLGFVLFLIWFSLLGWYVSPHAQPRISAAMAELLKSN